MALVLKSDRAYAGSDNPRDVASFAYAGVAHAWSLRAINGYTGRVVRVRRDSDDATAEFTAAEVTAGAPAQWAGSATVYVTLLFNQFGTKDCITIPNEPNRQPRLGVANGRPAVLFDGTDDFMAAEPLLAQPYTLSLLAAAGTPEPFTYFYEAAQADGSGTTGMASSINGMAGFFSGPPDNFLPLPTPAAGDLVSWAARINGAASAIFGTDGTAYPYDGSNAGAPGLMFIASNTATSTYSNMVLHEILIWAAPLSDERLGAIRADQLGYLGQTA